MPTIRQQEIVNDMFLTEEERKKKRKRREEWLDKFKTEKTPDWVRGLSHG